MPTAYSTRTVKESAPTRASRASNPSAVLTDADFTTLLNAANDLAVWTNGIASAPKELAHDETTSLVAVLQEQDRSGPPPITGPPKGTVRTIAGGFPRDRGVLRAPQAATHHAEELGRGSPDGDLDAAGRTSKKGWGGDELRVPLAAVVAVRHR